MAFEDQQLLRTPASHLLNYVKAGVPHSVIVEQLKVPERSVKEVALVYLSDNNDPAKNDLLSELELTASQIPELKRQQMLVRAEEL